MVGMKWLSLRRRTSAGSRGTGPGEPSLTPCSRHRIATLTLLRLRARHRQCATSSYDGVAARHHDWLGLQLRPMFEGRVLPVTEDVMFKRRLLVEEGRRAGHTFSQPDLIIAATALHHGMTIVSRDAAGYAKTGAALLNPWE